VDVAAHVRSYYLAVRHKQRIGLAAELQNIEMDAACCRRQDVVIVHRGSRWEGLD